MAEFIKIPIDLSLGIYDYIGTGDPTSALANAAAGSLYRRKDGGGSQTLYQKTSAGIWEALAAAATGGYGILSASNTWSGAVNAFNNRVTVGTTLSVGASATIDSTGDIRARRSATTGVIYFGDSASIYLYWDGTNYNFGTSGIVLHQTNFNTYAPTLTGTGASGTWGIGITGSAALLMGQVRDAAATVNTVVSRDASGDIYTRYFLGSYVNTTDDASGVTISYLMAKFGDNYLRSAPAAKVISFLGVPTNAGTGATGTWGISITGNAGTISNFSSVPARIDGNDYSLAGRTQGIYAIVGTGTNGPGGSGYMNLIHCANSTDVAFQITGGYVNDEMYFRGTSSLHTGGSYTAWRRVLHGGNYVGFSAFTGTVSGPHFLANQGTYYGAVTRDAAYKVVMQGNAFYWSHANTDYLNTIGTYQSAGYAYISFHNYQGASDTFYRGGGGVIPAQIRHDATGGNIAILWAAAGTADTSITWSSTHNFNNLGDLSIGRYLLSAYVNSSDDTSSGGSLSYIMAKCGDNYHRSVTAANVVTFLGVATLSGGQVYTVGPYTTDWFRSNTSGQGWYHTVHAVGIMADSTGVVKTYNTAKFKSMSTATDSLSSAGGIAATNDVWINQANYGYGLVGVYASTIIQAVFAMDNIYRLGAGGTLSANFYGIGWTYDASGGGVNTGYSCFHGIGVFGANALRSYIGYNIWTAGTIYAPSGGIVVGGASSIGGTLGVSGAATFSSTISVTGTATLLGAVDVTGAVRQKKSTSTYYDTPTYTVSSSAAPGSSSGYPTGHIWFQVTAPI